MLGLRHLGSLARDDLWDVNKKFMPKLAKTFKSVFIVSLLKSCFSSVRNIEHIRDAIVIACRRLHYSVEAHEHDGG
jgi:hypothetical protein